MTGPFLAAHFYVTIVHETLIVSLGSRVIVLIVDSAMIRVPAVLLEPEPLASASPLTVIVPPLRFVSTGVVSVNWQVPEEGAVPSLTTEHKVAFVVCT